MKLTEGDKTCLRSLEVPETDWPQIAAAAEKTVYRLLTDGERRLSRSEAMNLLGKRDFFSGLARSAFHWSAVRDTADGQQVYFDSSRFFR